MMNDDYTCCFHALVTEICHLHHSVDWHKIAGLETKYIHCQEYNKLKTDAHHSTYPSLMRTELIINGLIDDMFDTGICRTAHKTFSFKNCLSPARFLPR